MIFCAPVTDADNIQAQLLRTKEKKVNKLLVMLCLFIYIGFCCVQRVEVKNIKLDGMTEEK